MNVAFLFSSSQIFTAPKVLPTQGYGAAPRMFAFDQTQAPQVPQVPQIPIVTEAGRISKIPIFNKELSMSHVF